MKSVSEFDRSPIFLSFLLVRNLSEKTGRIADKPQ